jgi:flagellar biosynthesis protein FlhF
MALKAFRARTFADALTLVHRDLGASAQIVRTRTIKVGGIFGIGARSTVEIVAGPGGAAAGQSQSTPVAPRTARDKTRAGAPKTVAHSTDTSSPSPAASGGAESNQRLAAALAAAAYARSGTPAPHPASSPLKIRHDAPPMPSHPHPIPRHAKPAVATAPGPTGAALARPLRTEQLPPRALSVREAFAPVTPDSAPMAVLQDDLAAIKRMLGSVVQTAGPNAPGRMPEALFKHYLQLVEAQVAREIADEVVTGVKDELSAGELADEEIVRAALLRRLAVLIPAAADAPVPAGRQRGKPRVVALVGPTGVGKTTTVAKLAATYKLKHGLRVGLITADTYRIAAVEQLRTYASIIALPMRVALTPTDMAAACQAMRDCDVILIDTAGRSPSDAGKIEELCTFLAAAEPDEIHLVLASTTSEQVMMKTIEKFAPACPNRVLFTKLDEAVNFGVLVNVARAASASLSYLTMGQEVPDQIEPGRPERLAGLVLDGRLELQGAAL